MQTSLSPKIQLILNDAYEFFIRHFLQIASLCLPFLFANAVFQLILFKTYPSSPMSILAPMVFSLLVYPMYMAALIQFMGRRARNEQPKNSDLFLASIQQWGPFLILKVIMALLIIFGFSLLIVPGVWLWVRFSFAEFFLVLFGASPRQALEKSVAATRGHFGPLLLLMLVTYLPILILGLAADQLIQTMTPNAFFRILIITAWSLIELFVTVVLFRAFMEVMSQQNEA